jgi:hypothetical protein
MLIFLKVASNYIKQFLACLKIEKSSFNMFGSLLVLILAILLWFVKLESGWKYTIKKLLKIILKIKKLKKKLVLGWLDLVPMFYVRK